jgi:hypothetical protein
MSTETLITVTLTQKGSHFILSPGIGDAKLREGDALVTVTAPSRAKLYLNDELIECAWRAGDTVGFAHIDLTNHIGFHRIRVIAAGREQFFDFCTSTAKATWSEIQKMAEICASNYLAYQKQFTYISRSGERRKVFIPQIIYAWYRERIPEIEGLIRDISRRPATELRPRLVNSLRAKGISVPATIKLLHENPSLLEERADGPIQIGNTAYWPSTVRVRVTDRLPAAKEHARIASFLKMLVSGIDQLGTLVENALLPATIEWRSRLIAMQNMDVIRHYVNARADANLFASPVPSPIEQTDPRYRRLRDLAFEYRADIGASKSLDNSIRANIKDVWDIYQTFIAHAYGNAFGLSYLSPIGDLRVRDADGASMVSQRFRLYFDQKPPRLRMTSWRDDSLRPANERPDLVIIDMDTKRVHLLDAKFKTAKGGSRAESADLFEMQGYLNSFGVCSGGIVFPGQGADRRIIEGRGYRLGELPLRAQFYEALGGADAVHEYIRTSCADLWADLSD